MDIELLRERFYCSADSPTGLRMKISNGSRNPDLFRNAGDIAGFKHAEGYWEVGVKGVYLKVHRVIWILLHGQIPNGLKVDHRDGNGRNNNPTNLQLLTSGANSRAKDRLYRSNTSGFVGVYLQPNNSWVAVAGRENKRYYLGIFSTAKAAAKRFNEFAIAWAAEHGETPRYLNPV